MFCLYLIFTQTIQSFRTLSNGQRGEVYEVTGDQVAVILDSMGNNMEEGNKAESINKQDAKSSIYWIDSMLLLHTND